jgi:hypothetical protein
MIVDRVINNRSPTVLSNAISKDISSEGKPWSAGEISPHPEIELDINNSPIKRNPVSSLAGPVLDIDHT